MNEREMLLLGIKPEPPEPEAKPLTFEERAAIYRGVVEQSATQVKFLRHICSNTLVIAIVQVIWFVSWLMS